MLTALFALLARFAFASREHDCLREFYLSTDGPSWWANDGWDELLAGGEPDICSLWGIECSAETGEVVSISLTSNNLHGRVPDCLHVFQNLETLSLGHNSLSGWISGLPESIRSISIRNNDASLFVDDLDRLVSLRTLSLDNTATREELPASLLQSKNLTSLSLKNWGGKLSGGPVRLSVENYTKFSVPGTSFGQDLVVNLAASNTLKTLDISGATLSLPAVDIADLITGYPYVSELNLASHSLSGELNFSKLADLTSPLSSSHVVIDLSHSSISGKLDMQGLESYLQRERSLYAFSIAGTPISGICPSSSDIDALKAAHGLGILDLSASNLLCTDGCPYACISLALKDVEATRFSLTFSLSSGDPEIIVGILTSTASLRIRGENFQAHFSTSGPRTVTATVKRPFPGDLTANDVEVLYDGIAISSPVLEEKQTAPVQNYGEEVTPMLDVVVFGVSRCPDYVKTQMVDMVTLLENFPEVEEFSRFVYKSMVEADEYYISGGYDMHGHREVIGDRYYLCLQQHTGFDVHRMLEFQQCVYGDELSTASVPSNMDSCLDQVFSAADALAIKDCAWGEEGYKLTRKMSDRSIGYSPTLFLGSEMVCIDGVACQYDTSDATQKSLAVLMCTKYKEVYGVFPSACDGIVEENGNGTGLSTEELAVAIVVPVVAVIVAIVVTCSVIFCTRPRKTRTRDGGLVISDDAALEPGLLNTDE